MEQLHARRLALLYQHCLLLPACNAHLRDASQPVVSLDGLLTAEVRASLLTPKAVLRREVVRALRDCPNSPVFMALLCKYDNENIFAGVRVWAWAEA